MTRPDRPKRVYMILLDGLSHSELRHQLDHNPGAIPNLAGLVERGAMLSHGSIVNFPSITWPSHSTILTGAWCGHHDVVNPTFHLREHRETVPIQGNIFETERYLSSRRRDALRGLQARRRPRRDHRLDPRAAGTRRRSRGVRAAHRRRQGAAQGAHRRDGSRREPAMGRRTTCPRWRAKRSSTSAAWRK